MPKNKSKLISVLIPIIAAVVVVSVLATSGHITKNTDESSPTAQTSASAANEETTQQDLSKSSVNIIAVGDNLIHSQIFQSGEQDDGTYDFSDLYTTMESTIKEADIAIINQETILGGDVAPYSGYPTFNSPQEIGDAAIAAGFDIFTCATNHSMDMGYAGIEAELEYFEQHPEVTAIGLHNSDNDGITYYTKNNITFALLNYTYGTNGIDLPSDKPYCVSLLDEETVTQDIQEARENADVVIVFPHWGDENSHEISDYQKTYTELFASLNVDIVIGTHTHTIQPVEWVDRADGSQMLVYYSLGNFISHQVNLYQLLGGMAEITVTKDNGEISITSAKFKPLVTWYTQSSDSSKCTFSTYLIEEYTDDLAQSHVQSGATVEYFTELAQDVISEEFLDMG